MVRRPTARGQSWKLREKSRAPQYLGVILMLLGLILILLLSMSSRSHAATRMDPDENSISTATGVNPCETLSEARASNPRAHLRYHLDRKAHQKCWFAPIEGRSAASSAPRVRPHPSVSRPPTRVLTSPRRGAPTIAPMALVPPPVVASGQDDGSDDIIRALCSNDFGCPTFESRWRVR